MLSSSPAPHRSELKNLRRAGLIEIGEDGHGKMWKISKNGTITSLPAPTSQTTEEELTERYDICLIVQEQLDDAPDHWALFVGPEGKPGKVIQVKGDPWPGMNRTDSQNINIFASGSYRYSHLLGVISPDKVNSIVTIADSFDPPKAEKVHPQNENCQNWTTAVVAQLEEHDLVTAGSAKLLASNIGKHWRFS